jgi:hypothetical protein
MAVTLEAQHNEQKKACCTQPSAPVPATLPVWPGIAGFSFDEAARAVSTSFAKMAETRR